MVMELEEVPMSIVGGLDVHRKQLTFDYVEAETGRLERGRISPADREQLAGWLRRFDGVNGVAFAVEAGTGWRYVVEEMRAAGVEPHLAEPADTSTLRGPKRRAKTDKADARLLRELLAAGRVPECYIPPSAVLEWRALLELYHDLRVEHTGWAKRIHATCFHQGTTSLGEAGVIRGSRERLDSSSPSSCRWWAGCRSTPLCRSWTRWRSIWTGCAGGWSPPAGRCRERVR
jgi:transposase